MALLDTIKKVEEWRGSKIVSMIDCGDRWAFTFEDDYPKPAPVFDKSLPEFVKNVITCPDVLHTFMFKDDDRFEYFCLGDYADLLRAGKPIQLPE